MPRGSAPGEHRGGRVAGVPNKRTLAILEAKRVHEEAKRAVQAKEAAERAHIKLGKDVLEDFMQAFGTIAAIYQNRLVASAQSGLPMSPADLNEFERWGSLAAQTAKHVADFQSPKFKAIQVVAPQPAPTETMPMKTVGGNVVAMKDPVAFSRVYANIVKAAGKR